MNQHKSAIIIGHRGVAGLRPENTLASFKHAAQLGVKAVEFDVQLTKDKQWAVMHDYTVDRTTNGQGLVSNYSLAEICTLHAGLWYQPAYPDELVPSLEQTLDLTRSLGLQTNIEIKLPENTPSAISLENAQALATFIQGYYKDKLALPIVSSFELPCLIYLRELMPKLPIAYLIDNFATDSIAVAQKYRFDSINCDVRNITEIDLTQAQSQSMPVLLYTINDKSTADFWVTRGVAGIFSDRPDLVS